ncbi:MAG: DUF5685 family protein [Eubacterium sp.]
MFGYVITQKEELKVREFNIYNGYYCGLCKTIGAEYGQLLRFGLQFEMAFLALFLESLSPSPDEVSTEHCAAHHIKKKPVIRCSAQKYAAAMTIILGYENNRDDIQDDGHTVKNTAQSILLHRAYSKAKAEFPEAAEQVHGQLQQLYELERQNCSSIDYPANAFGEVMKTVFLSYFLSGESGPEQNVPVQTETSAELRIISAFAYHLGRWIYMIDALDDLEKDKKTGSFNPFTAIPPDRVTSLGSALLFHALGEMSKALDLLDIKKNRGIIENIVYLGLHSKTDQVLGKGEIKNNGK